MRSKIKEVAYIAAAFLVLCAISMYRQINTRMDPENTIRPVVVYFVYVFLLAMWWRSIRNRVTGRNMRFFLFAEHIVMLVALTIRFFQDSLIHHIVITTQNTSETTIIRIWGYLAAVPSVLLPLFGLYASFSLSRNEEYRINRRWYYLLIPAAGMILLLLTNEHHYFMYNPWDIETQNEIYYHPSIGIYIIFGWALALLTARLLLIYKRSSMLTSPRMIRQTPIYFAITMLLVNIPYFSASFVVTFELMEYSVLIYFLEILIWESCIILLMVPINTHYDEVFDRSTIAMQIVYEDGTSYRQSSSSPVLEQKMFEQLKGQSPVQTFEGQEIHLHAISSGYAIWLSDISQTIAVITELRETADKLENESILLRQEVTTRSDEEAVKEQNRIYNQLTEDIGAQLALLRNMLDTQECDVDNTILFKKICLIGAYVKRRCNLRLIEESVGVIMNSDLNYSFSEVIRWVEDLNIEARIKWNTDKQLEPEFAIFAFDTFEFLLEYEDFELSSISLTFDDSTVFSANIRLAANVGNRDIPVNELTTLSRGNFDIRWESYTDGYQALVSY